jgi:hypothetical protein
MTGKELYPLVYQIVKRAQKENLTLKNYTNYYQWSLRIPIPKTLNDELADALCTSVSSSAGVGLEIYYQEKVYLIDLQSTFLDNQLSHLLSDNNLGGKSYRVLGEIIRSVFKGRLVPNEKDKELLNSI